MGFDYDHEKFMKKAMLQAEKAASIGEVPIGCVIVREGKIIARGYNRRKKDKTDDGNTKNIKVKRADIAAEIGAGVDFYTGYFKFGVEAKWSFGLLDIMDPQGKIYDSSMNGLRDRMFHISLTFE